MEDYGAAISVGAEQCFFGDWVMTKVGTQLGLESCSTFVVGDHVSAKLAIDHPVYEQNGVRRRARVLSKQELYDCCKRKTRGLIFRYAYPYVVEYGLHLGVFYPYIGADDQECKCPTLEGKPKVGIKGWSYMTDRTAIVDELQRQPLAASVVVYNSLILHKGLAVWSPKEGEKPYVREGFHISVRHAVLLTGYGVDEDGIEYYTAKGSWGTHRWLNGYIRIRRDLLSYICRIEEDVNWKN